MRCLGAGPLEVHGDHRSVRLPCGDACDAEAIRSPGSAAGRHKRVIYVGWAKLGQIEGAKTPG